MSDRRFDKTIELPNGRIAETLRDGGLARPPDKRSPGRQPAMNVLIEAADGRGPITFAQVGMFKAIHRSGDPKRAPGGTPDGKRRR